MAGERGNTEKAFSSTSYEQNYLLVRQATGQVHGQSVS